MSGPEAAAGAGDPRSAARAIDAMRRGWPVRLSGTDGALTLVAVERLGAEGGRAWLKGSRGLLLSPSRAATLKLLNQRAAADTHMPVLIARPDRLDAPLAMAIADPVRDLQWPMKGPFEALPLDACEAASAAIELGRLAGLLPAFLVAGESMRLEDVRAEAEASAADIAAYNDGSRLQIAARAKLPTQIAENAEIVSFRTDADAADHVALIIDGEGVRDGDADDVPLVRVHSECLTGDIFGSLKCDCGPQLYQAMREMTDTKRGILLYLRQEGRGIGLVNKLRAYELQAQGFDTVDANLRLGFAVDARQFSIAARMLRLLGVERLRLLTNNPEKVAGLEAEGLTVIERVSLAIAANPHNERYLETKRNRTGHQL